MKNYIVPISFIGILLVTFIICVWLINVRLDNKFFISTGEKNLTNREIYEKHPEYMGHKVYKKYIVTKQFKSGTFYPIIETDTTWENKVYAKKKD